jgi:hypothetical protein
LKYVEVPKSLDPNPQRDSSWFTVVLANQITKYYQSSPVESSKRRSTRDMTPRGLLSSSLFLADDPSAKKSPKSAGVAKIFANSSFDQHCHRHFTRFCNKYPGSLFFDKINFLG